MQIKIALERPLIMRLTYLLLVVDVLLVAAFAMNYIVGEPIGVLTELIHLDGEGNVPAWFSSSQLLIVGITIFLAVQNVRTPLAGSRAFWLALAAGFVFLSFDEGAVFHEKITIVFRRWDWAPRFQGDHGIWIFLYGISAVVFLFIGFKQLRSFYQHHPTEFKFFMVGAFLLVAGAVGVEVFGYEFIRYEGTPLFYTVQVIIEELLELVGVTVIFHSVLLFFAQPSVVAEIDRFSRV